FFDLIPRSESGAAASVACAPGSCDRFGAIAVVLIRVTGCSCGSRARVTTVISQESSMQQYQQNRTKGKRTREAKERAIARRLDAAFHFGSGMTFVDLMMAHGRQLTRSGAR